jgi:chemotaxis protein CheC
LEEVGNIVLNSILGTMSNEAQVNLNYSVPKLSVGHRIDAQILLKSQETDAKLQFVLADTRFRVVNTGVVGSLILVFECGSLQTMLDAVLSKAVGA